MDKTMDMVAILRVGEEALSDTAPDCERLLCLEFTPAQAALLCHAVGGMIKRLSLQQMGHCERDIQCAGEALSYMHRLLGQASHYAEDHRIVVSP